MQVCFEYLILQFQLINTLTGITFERISKAYDILGDQSKRSQYDIKFKARLERLRAEAAMSSERKRMRDGTWDIIVIYQCNANNLDLLKKEKEAKKQKMEDYRLQEELRRKVGKLYRVLKR